MPCVGGGVRNKDGGSQNRGPDRDYASRSRQADRALLLNMRFAAKPKLS
jgi:hypothetical protein